MPASGTITALERGRRDPGRVTVSLDGAFAFGLSWTLVVQYGLQVGQYLSERDVEELRTADEAERAVQAGLRLLAARPRSEHELRERLRRKGFCRPAIETAVARLRHWRYLDDAEFARQWIAHRQGSGPRGRRLLEMELRAKGVDPATASAAVEAAEVDEETLARRVALKHRERLTGLDPMIQYRRLAGVLQRRGFEWAVIRHVLETIDREDGTETGSVASEAAGEPSTAQ